ncbi:hypothetical protein CC78DRAFT_584765 [Lojkania enalia]|uniref:PARG catalytic Macro domain-containing protein n=1 Tax=Lojkania enalia TaxID=147567 RepID=A0A9P4K395_9PLEO|nr:hypothetical protein CC78DRAFT_584765 [Didymosphaeria enalia]
MRYLLPTHLSIKSDDPLSVLAKDDAPQAEVLDALLATALVRLRSSTLVVDILQSLIEDLAYTIHGNGSIDTANLRKYIDRSVSSLYTCPATVENVVHAARSLPSLFPEQSLYTPCSDGDIVACNGAQIDALLAHQLLGTLSQPSGATWGLPDFTSWFAANPAHRNAVDGYLTTVFDHFARGGYGPDYSFMFMLRIANEMPDPSQCNRSPTVRLHLVPEESEPSELPQPTFVLVAAHSQPGPGATATQEERLQSASLALSTSALFTPKIPDEGAVITSAFPVHAAWKGHNRTARLDRLFPADGLPRRHYILADALPLDEMYDNGDGLRDLQPGRVEREVRKLYASFSGAIRMRDMCYCNLNEACVVETGAWGCGAFGGNILVKAMCMMIAAGLTGIELHLTLLEPRVHDIEAVKTVLTENWTAAELWKRITRPDAGQLMQSTSFPNIPRV